MIRRAIFLLGLTLVVSALTVITVRLRAQQTPPSKKPFTAIVLKKLFDKNRNQFGTEMTLTAIRGDGSQVDIMQLLQNKVIGTKVIIDVASKQRISVDPITESRTTYHYSDKWFLRFATPPPCSEGPDAEHSTVLGRQVFKITQNMDPSKSSTTDEDSTVVEQWVAPELDCFPLRSTISQVIDGVLIPQQVREVISLIPGEPDPSLFQIPANYVERSPMEVSAEFERRTGKQAVGSSRTANALEDAYNNSQPRKPPKP